MNSMTKKEVRDMIIEQQQIKNEEEKTSCEICEKPLTLTHDNITVKGDKPQNYTILIPDYCSDKCATAGEL